MSGLARLTARLVNHKRVARHYAEAGRQVRHRKRKQVPAAEPATGTQLALLWRTRRRRVAAKTPSDVPVASSAAGRSQLLALAMRHIRPKMER